VKARQYNDQKGFRVMLFKPIFNNISVIEASLLSRKKR
jgi:hypothetical protein